MTMSKLIKLLNEPGKIITMATRVLAEHGKEDSMFHEDRGYYFTTMICSYQDIPNKKINIVGVRDMKKE